MNYVTVKPRTFHCLIALASLAVSACSAPATSENTDALESALTTPAPEIDFTSRPTYLPNNTIIFTFDDGPDHTNTPGILDALKEKGVKATFFINTKNWSDVDSEPAMQALIRRMVDEGHTLGNHTAHHLHLGTLDAATIKSESSGVEQTVKHIFGASAQALTLFRAPFGEPYQGNDPANPSAAYRLVAPIVKKHAVEIGWSFDTFDYNCTEGDDACVYQNFTQAVRTVGNGAYGIVLMHAVHSQTVKALPRIIDYVRNNRFTIRSVEDAVKARYGKSSAEIVHHHR